MQTQFAFFVSIAFSLIAWGMVGARYIWPQLRIRQRAEALRHDDPNLDRNAVVR